MTYFLFSPELVEDVVFTSRSMFTTWASPTQTFGALLFAAVVVLLARPQPFPRPQWAAQWAALGLLLAVLTGAKATYLPLLLAGSLLVVAVRAVVERRVPRAWAGVAALTLVCLLFAQFVVFRQGDRARRCRRSRPCGSCGGRWRGSGRRSWPPPRSCRWCC
ncbi:hypothetical protein ACFQYP_45365 [Nonomuraea antimicrobica]